MCRVDHQLRLAWKRSQIEPSVHVPDPGAIHELEADEDDDDSGGRERQSPNGDEHHRGGGGSGLMFCRSLRYGECELHRADRQAEVDAAADHPAGSVGDSEDVRRSEVGVRGRAHDLPRKVGSESGGNRQQQRIAEGMLLLVSMGFLSLAVFVDHGTQVPYPVHYLIFPAAIWAALRLGQQATATLVFGVFLTCDYVLLHAICFVFRVLRWTIGKPLRAAVRRKTRAGEAMGDTSDFDGLLSPTLSSRGG